MAAEVAHVVALPVHLNRSIQVNEIKSTHSLLVALSPPLMVDDIHYVLQQTKLQLLVTHLHQRYHKAPSRWPLTHRVAGEAGTGIDFDKPGLKVTVEKNIIAVPAAPKA